MSAIDDLRGTMVRLRAECPWDREQTHQSLARCLIDECSELLETIDELDLPHMREELGDVLIQVIFHALLAEEAGQFNFDDVARDINTKLIRRHPHVFGASALATSEQVIAQWDQIKAAEKARAARPPDSAAVFKDLPPRLPALMLAEAVWKQIDKKRLPADGAVDVAHVQALGRQLTDESLGRMLFETAAAARTRGLDAEGALRRHADKVRREVEEKMPVASGPA
jgi:XTP/dITP diphosphohydrolase/tetrapyrrole methylase family protein/MazG family protein